MGKVLRKVWYCISQIHTIDWIFEKIGVWPMIGTSLTSLSAIIISYIRSWPEWLWGMFLVIFCCSLMMVVGYIKNRKRTKKHKNEQQIDKKSLTRDARALMGEWLTAKEAMEMLGINKDDFLPILIQKKLPVYDLFRVQINIRDLLIDNAWEGAREYARDSKCKDEYNISLIESGKRWEMFKKKHIPTHWDHPARADEIYCIILFKKTDIEAYKQGLR